MKRLAGKSCLLHGGDSHNLIAPNPQKEPLMLKLKVDLTAEDEARLQALREAADVGFADIVEGRFQTFDAPESLRRHLSQLAENAVSDPAAEM